MADKIQIRKRILEIANEKFRKFGYKKVTTDEIASEVGISKRTLYEQFAQKKDLVKELITSSSEFFEKVLDKILNDKMKNPVQKIVELAKQSKAAGLVFDLKNMNELRRNFPDLAKMANDFKYKQIKKVYVLFQQGVEQGLFRSDVKHDVFLIMFTNIFDKFYSEDGIQNFQFTLEEMLDSFIKVFLQGLLAKDAINKKYLVFLENQ